MTVSDARFPRGVAIALAIMFAVRLIGAAVTPLAFDEAYYWMWSKHLAGGYYDHPPMVAVVIRLGTMLAGDTELGVRLVSVLSAIPMTWAVWRGAMILFGNARLAANAALLLNATMMVSIGTLIVTPDSPLLVASAFVLFFLAKVLETGQGAWWLATGAAIGCALLSKYTAFLFGPGILIWLIVQPRVRHWLRSPWPYLGAAVAFALFAPVVIWNAEHQWLSFLKQFGRAKIESYTLKYFIEIVPAQFGFTTPLVFIPGVMGLLVLLRGDRKTAAERGLVNALYWPIMLYFFWHSLHERAEANWFGPVYPSFSIAAALALEARWPAPAKRMVDFCGRWAAPGSIAVLAILLVQANTGWLTLQRRDPTVKFIGVGWREAAQRIEAERKRVGAGCVLASDYGTTGWLAFYLPPGTCVAERGERYRWVNMPAPDATFVSDKVLFVDNVGSAGVSRFAGDFAHVEKIGEVARRRGPLTIETYEIDLLQGPRKGTVFDDFPPPELFTLPPAATRS